MQTVKRLYLYGVLGVALALLLWGLTDLLRFALDQVAGAVGTSPALDGRFAGEELSRAVALVIVAGSIFTVHLALVRQGLRGLTGAVADERASVARSTYFFLALAGTGAVLGLALIDLVEGLITTVGFGARGWQPVAPLASITVFGVAWSLHLRFRRHDLRSLPQRLAGDWLTRAYLYGTLLVTLLIATIETGEVLVASARWVLDLRPAWVSDDWWQESISGPLAATIVASGAWLSHWLLGTRLLQAPDPMGVAQRGSLTRRGYFLTLVLVSTSAVLMLATLALRHVLAEMEGAWRSTEGSTLLEDIGGPLLMALPFVLAWWWHQRRVVHEALAMGGVVLARSVGRVARLVVAIVGLAGLSAGLAWQLRQLLDALGSSARGSVFSEPGFGVIESAALALAIAGFLLWLPTWMLLQRDCVAHRLEAATDTARRAYLMLVLGTAVVAAMGSLAYLVWQAARSMLDTGATADISWAVSILSAATLVLVYHLWQLRADLRLALVKPETLPEPEAAPYAHELEAAPYAHETIEITAPVGSDFRVLNAAIRSELPDGYQLRVLSHRP